MTLSKKQRAALDYLRDSRPAPVNTISLARILDTTPEGAVMTASSLVRQGLARRVRVRGYVHYEAVA